MIFDELRVTAVARLASQRAMHKLLLAVSASALSSSLAAAAPAPLIPPPAQVAALRDDALANDHYAWDVVEALTVEVGQRLAGTEARARD